MSEPINPYAPTAITPDEESPREEPFREGLAWTNGVYVFIRSGAALPNRCMVTGELTSHSFPLRIFWQPRWVKYLVLLFVIPYLIASPIVGRYAEIKAPLASRILKQHIRIVRIGFVIMVISAGLFFGPIVLVISGLAPSSIGNLMPLGFFGGLVGFLIAARRPYNMKIVEIVGDLLVLRKVHPGFMQVLPMAEVKEAAPNALPERF